MGEPVSQSMGSEEAARARARSLAATLPARSPRRLVAAGMIGVLLLATFFMTGTFTAIGYIDSMAVDAELQRADRALAAALGDGLVLDASSIDRLGHEYALEGTRMAAPGTLAEGEVSVPLPGNPSFVLAWTPRRFATEAFNIVAPMRLGLGALVIGIVGFVMLRLHDLARDLEARRKLAQEMASRDPLTGLRNRLTFDHELREGFNADGPRGHGLALFYLDLDGFKTVNDSLGHLAGDELLRIVGDRLIAAVDPADTVARLGGDEFAIIRRGSINRGDLAGLALQIEKALTGPFEVEDLPVNVGVSIGIARAPRDARTADELVRAADAALYRAKAEGGSLFVFAENNDEAFRQVRRRQAA
jgi:diguanylate cyclase (GGDEF)-like protein